MALRKRNIPITSETAREAFASIGYEPPEGAQVSHLMEFRGSDLSDVSLNAIFDMLDESSAAMLFLAVLSRSSGIDFLDIEDPATITVEKHGTRLVIAAVHDPDGEPF